MTEPNPLRQAMRDLVAEAYVSAFAEERAGPHIVVSYDPETRSSTAFGPYEDGPTALLAAEAMSADMNSPANNDGAFVSYAVAPLLPRHDLER